MSAGRLLKSLATLSVANAAAPTTGRARAATSAPDIVVAPSNAANRCRREAVPRSVPAPRRLVMRAAKRRARNGATLIAGPPPAPADGSAGLMPFPRGEPKIAVAPFDGLGPGNEF